MKIYCTTQSKIDPRLEPFIGTDIWILGNFPWTVRGAVSYVNLVSQDNGTITYNRITVPQDADGFTEACSHAGYRHMIRQYMEPRYSHVENCSEFQFSPIEPYTFITTDDILELVEDAGCEDIRE